MKDTGTLFEKVVAGEVRLLSAEQICERLGVSRTTFDRWVRNGDPLGSIKNNGALAKGLGMGAEINQGLMDAIENLPENRITFPKPDVRIGKSPRWQFETVVQWLKQNSSVT